MTKPVILAQNLSKKYGDFTAVDGIDFAIHNGECFGFLGPNGAGKTSTMKMIYGFNTVTFGRLDVLGLDVETQLREIKAQLGVIPQEDNLDPDLKVFQNLRVYARYFDIPKQTAIQRCTEALEMFQLSEKRDKYIHELSGGMKRRLVIARSLLNQPKIIIADEPTTGLDPQARRLVWQKLQQLKQQNVTLVLTTHYMEEAAQLCDRLAIMDRGKILEIGTPKGLIEQHVAPEVVELQLRQDQLSTITAELASTSIQHEAVGDTIYAYTTDAHALGEQLRAHDGILRLVERQATLEDVFLTLTGHALDD